MAKSHNQKIKILILAQMLAGTGDDRVVTMQEILEHLGQYGISAERKSIYDDMEALRDFGYDIQYKRGRSGGYYLKSCPGGETAAQAETAPENTDGKLQEHTDIPSPESREDVPAVIPEEWPEAAEERQEAAKEKPGAAEERRQVRKEEISGSGKMMKLLCKKEREKELREYFGGMGEYKTKSSGYISAVVPHTAGPYFFGWLTAMGRDVHIVKPKKTAAAYRDYLKILAKDYKGL